MKDVIVAGKSLDILGRVCFLGFAVTLIVFVFEYGRITYGLAFLEKYAPDMTMFGLVKVAVSATAAFSIFLAAWHDLDQNTFTSAAERSHSVHTVIIANLALLISSAVVVFNPEILNETVREGQIVSILTEIILLSSVLIFGLCAWRSRILRNRTILSVPVWIVFLSMTFICALIAMEEMSWGQHWFGWEAGEAFRNNAQNETNLHNFATYKFEAAYYTAAIFSFVLVPAFWSVHLHPRLADIAPLVPGRMFALAGMSVAGLMFEEWNIQVYQVWFFLAFIVGMWISITADDFSEKSLAIVTSVILLVTQLVFIGFGSAMVDGYELSEIREFMISVLIASYALLMYRRLLIASDR